MWEVAICTETAVLVSHHYFYCPQNADFLDHMVLWPIVFKVGNVLQH